MPAALHFSQHDLPATHQERQLLLQRYFQRQDIQLSETPDGWQVQADWTPNAAYYIDPQLQTGLALWPSKMSTVGIPLAVTQDQGFLLALNDCWSLFAWSLQVADKPNQPKHINLLHLDSHTDLNSPRLCLGKQDQWQDMLTGDAFNLEDPMSVVNAIKSGAIGIGSFICPLIACGMSVDLYHLSPAQHFRYAPDRYDLSLELERNDPLFSDAVRPVLKVGNAHASSSYTLSDNMSEICAELDTRYPTFLHIDLDYFNNRFDGRPDWQGKTQRHDPGIAEVLERVDLVFGELALNNIKLVDISIGISPGFFPAEYWHATLQRIRHHVTALSC